MVFFFFKKKLIYGCVFFFFVFDTTTRHILRYNPCIFTLVIYTVRNMPVVMVVNVQRIVRQPRYVHFVPDTVLESHREPFTDKEWGWRFISENAERSFGLCSKMCPDKAVGVRRTQTILHDLSPVWICYFGQYATTALNGFVDDCFRLHHFVGKKKKCEQTRPSCDDRRE